MESVLQIDHAIIAYLGQFARRSPAFDRMIMHMLSNELAKGGIVIAAMWWVWFTPAAEQWQRRVAIVKALFAGIIAAGLSQVIQISLPGRLRPMNGAPAFVPPVGLGADAVEWMRGWSSFPSDHAALFFALAVGLYLADRRFGIFALAWSAIVICLPRIYLGFHYPSDIVAGAILGTVIAVAVSALRVPDKRQLRDIVELRPAPFYSLAFLTCFELGQLFQNARSFASQLIQSGRLLLGGI